MAQYNRAIPYGRKDVPTRSAQRYSISTLAQRREDVRKKRTAAKIISKIADFIIGAVLFRLFVLFCIGVVIAIIVGAVLLIYFDILELATATRSFTGR